MPLEPTVPDPNSPPPPGGSGDPPPAPAPVAAQRPDYIPETIWDGEKNAPKIDLAATLTEFGTLKEQATARAALIPAKPEEYKFDLPQDFEMPQGYTWKQDPNDPVITGFRELATELKLTQPEVQRLIADAPESRFNFEKLVAPDSIAAIRERARTNAPVPVQKAEGDR